MTVPICRGGNSAFAARRISADFLRFGQPRAFGWANVDDKFAALPGHGCENDAKRSLNGTSPLVRALTDRNILRMLEFATSGYCWVWARLGMNAPLSILSRRMVG